jgi:hypothetical protein
MASGEGKGGRASVAGGCCGDEILESGNGGELGYASLESKSEIAAYRKFRLGLQNYLQRVANEIYLELLG